MKTKKDNLYHDFASVIHALRLFALMEWLKHVYHVKRAATIIKSIRFRILLIFLMDSEGSISSLILLIKL